MTIQETIVFLKDYLNEEVFTDDCIEAHKTAISALEKQIPKKPIFVDTRFRHHGRTIAQGSSLDECYKCPNCNSHIFHVFDSENNCVHCGQALDWSDNNG